MEINSKKPDIFKEQKQTSVLENSLVLRFRIAQKLFLNFLTAVASKLMIQPDGNAVLYDETMTVVFWSAGTNGNPGSSLVVQDDGNMVILSQLETVLWSSKNSASCSDDGSLADVPSIDLSLAPSKSQYHSICGL